jgi:hypothetical protein
MELAHAQTLMQARSCLAALADGARTVEVSSAYERVLIEIDRVHGDDSPALDATGLTTDSAVLYAIATSAVEELVEHGVDELHVELILTMLIETRDLDGA